MNDEVLYRNHPAMFRDNPVLFVFLVGLSAVSVFGFSFAMAPGMQSNLFLLLALVPIFAGGLGLLAWYLGVRSNLLTVTPTRMLYERGLLSKRRKEVRLADIRAVEVYQSLFNRMMDTGTVTVFTTGDEAEIVVKGMPQPNRIKELCRASRSGEA